MDPFHGMGVGAEVELNDGTSAVEDYTPIKLENKRDLPLWHSAHYCGDSSSDDSLDQQYLNSPPPNDKILEMPIKIRVVKNDELENHIEVLSTTGNIQPVLFYIEEEQRDDQALVLVNTCSEDLQEQAFPLAPYFEEPDIPCTEVTSSSDLGQPQPHSIEVYTETTLPCEEDPSESSGKYKYFDARKQCNKSVNSLERSHRCLRCGRQFARLCNLEHHICIKMAVDCSQQNSNNPETMNRLEKMCAEAQKELHSLQGQYKKENLGTEIWKQEPLSGSGRVIAANNCTVPRDHKECESKSISTQEFRISCNNHTKSLASQNVTALGNTIGVGLTNCSPLFSAASRKTDLTKQIEGVHLQLAQTNGEWTHLNQRKSFQKSEENSGQTTKEATKNYKCQECGKVYNRRSSVTNHMRWHTNEKNFTTILSSLKGPLLGGQDSLSTTLVSAAPQDVNANGAKPAATFPCRYCGKVFSKHCSFVTHIQWHLKHKLLATVISTPGSNQETGQVSSSPVTKPNSNGACASSVEVFTCQYCGRVFNKRCAYTNHSRWHVKEQMLHKGFKAKAQGVLTDMECSKDGDSKKALNHNVMVFDVATNKVVSGTYLDNGYIQGYYRPVNQQNLDEQHNLTSRDHVAKKSESEEPFYPSPATNMETNQHRPLEVLESVLELVVGTEEVHEILLSKEGHVFRKAEDYANAEEVVDVGDQDTEKKVEPKERPVCGIQSEPTKEQISGTQLEPTEKQYSLQLLPSKLKVKSLRKPKPPHRCRDCGVRFHQFWRLKQHRFKGFGKRSLKRHQCDCGRTPIGSLHFLLHQLQHLSDTAFVCAVCNKSLNGYHQLQAHSWVHPMVSQFQCKCGTRFSKLTKYLWHSLKNKAKPKPKLQLGCSSGGLL